MGAVYLLLLNGPVSGVVVVIAPAIIDLAAEYRPTLDLFAEYSPTVDLSAEYRPTLDLEARFDP